MFRWPGFILLAAWCIGAAPGVAQTRIGSINTNFRWLGPDDKIVIERYDDPRVANVSCYLSRAQTGGIKGGLGVAEDPSRFSIACRAVGRVEIPSNLPKSEVVGFSSASLFFKTFQIHRMYDAEKRTTPVWSGVGWRMNLRSPTIRSSWFANQRPSVLVLIFPPTPVDAHQSVIQLAVGEVCPVKVVGASS
jgi:CreA protein